MPKDKYFLTENNLGRECMFWKGVNNSDPQRLGGIALGCTFPKLEIEGRKSCEGLIDNVCLNVKDGRPIKGMLKDTIGEMKRRRPTSGGRNLPPGEIE